MTTDSQNRKRNGHLDYLLTAYVFDSLSAAGRREVQEHLGQCAQCRAQLSLLIQTVGLAEQALDSGGCEYVFEERRRQRVLEAARHRSIAPTFKFSWISAVAALLMVTVLVGLLLPAMSVRRSARMAADSQVAGAPVRYSDSTRGTAPSKYSAPADEASPSVMITELAMKEEMPKAAPREGFVAGNVPKSEAPADPGQTITTTIKEAEFAFKAKREPAPTRPAPVPEAKPEPTPAPSVAFAPPPPPPVAKPSPVPEQPASPPAAVAFDEEPDTISGNDRTRRVKGVVPESKKIADAPAKDALISSFDGDFDTATGRASGREPAKTPALKYKESRDRDLQKNTELSAETIQEAQNDESGRKELALAAKDDTIRNQEKLIKQEREDKANLQAENATLASQNEQLGEVKKKKAVAERMNIPHSDDQVHPDNWDAINKRTGAKAKPGVNAPAELPSSALELPVKLESRDVADVIIPGDILEKAELGDHFETINPDRPDTKSAFGNPSARMFHSVRGNEDPAGGGLSAKQIKKIEAFKKPLAGEVSDGGHTEKVIVGGILDLTGKFSTNTKSVAEAASAVDNAIERQSKDFGITTPKAPMPGIVNGPDKRVSGNTAEIGLIDRAFGEAEAAPSIPKAGYNFSNVGGGGVSGESLDDLIGVGGASSPGTGGAWGGGNGTGTGGGNWGKRAKGKTAKKDGGKEIAEGEKDDPSVRSGDSRALGVNNLDFGIAGNDGTLKYDENGLKGEAAASQTQPYLRGYIRTEESKNTNTEVGDDGGFFYELKPEGKKEIPKAYGYMGYASVPAYQSANKSIDVNALELMLRGYRHLRADNPNLTWNEYLRRPAMPPAVALSDEGLDEDAYIEKYGTRPFVDCARDHLSTFGMDVDTASYSLARSRLKQDALPEPESVRVEEFLNYFKQPYRVAGEDAFGVFVDGMPNPFGAGCAGTGSQQQAARDTHKHGTGGQATSGTELLKIGIKSREARADERKAAMLTFVIDTSGSMTRQDRLELVRAALKSLLAQLNPEDALCIIGFNDQPELLLPRTQARQKQRILDAIDAMRTHGGTNVEAGLAMAYRLADEAYTPDAVNRVVLCSDGVANVGAKGPDEILKLVKVFAGRGIDLCTVGFGMGQYNDQMMVKLADSGNGSCHFVDSRAEAEKIFKEQLPPHLNVLARDAKVQVDFNPEVVERYRLLGYEKRKIADKDFRNDKIDAGEVAHSTLVTVLYEIQRKPAAHGALGKVYLRWKDAAYRHLPVVERNYPLSEGVLAGSVQNAAPELRFLACVARFAELLRGSKWVQDGSYAAVLEQLAQLPPQFQSRPEFSEVRELVTKAQMLSVKQWAAELRK